MGSCGAQMARGLGLRLQACLGRQCVSIFIGNPAIVAQIDVWAVDRWLCDPGFRAGVPFSTLAVIVGPDCLDVSRLDPGID